MRYLDLTDLVALAAEVSEVEMPKLLELLDSDELSSLFAVDRRLAPHEVAASLLAGVLRVAPLPEGNARLAVLSAAHLLALNGLEADLDPKATRALLAGAPSAPAVAEWLDERVTAQDPLGGTLRESLSEDAWRGIALAVQRARRHRRPLASPDDLLFGLFREGSGPASRVLGAGGSTAAVASTEPSTAGPSFAPRTRKAFELALRAATTLGHPRLNTGHLLLGLLDAAHVDALPDDVSPDELRQKVLDALAPDTPAPSDVDRRLGRLADRLRRTDPAAARELDDIIRLQEDGLDRLVGMVRAWRGELFLDAVSRDGTVVRLLGGRLGPPPETVQDRLLADYLADISRSPQLSRSEEEALVACMRTAPPQEAAMCQRRMIQANLSLVVGIARKFQPVGVSLLDLILEGNLGLMRAVERYDPAKGYRFATYATWWVRRYVQRAIGRFPAGAGG